MFLKKVKLFNFCQHIDKTIEFQKGLNVIVGPNGSGKSNIINGVYGALTGDFSRNAGKTTENISINRAINAPSGIDLEFSHGNNDLRIVRRLDPADRQFFVGDKVYTADKDVSEKLSHILEVDKDILNQYVFVEQWDHFGPLSLSPAKRISAFQKLFKIDQLTKISDELSEGSLKMASVSTSIFDLPALIVKKSETEDYISKIESSISDLPTIDSLDQSMVVHTSLINDWKRKQKLIALISTREETITVLNKEKDKHQKGLNKLTTDLVDADDNIQSLKEAFESANQIEAAWIKYDYYVIQKTSYEKKLDKLILEKSLKAEPIEPEGYNESDEELQKLLDDVKFKLVQHTNFIKSIDVSDDSATCPTCGTSAKNLRDKWDQASIESIDLSDKVVELTKSIQDNRAYDKAKVTHLLWLNGHEKQISEVSRSMASLNVETKPEFSRDEAKNIISNYNELKNNFINIGKAINKIDVEMAKTTTALEQQEQEFTKEKEEIDKYKDINEEAVETAQTAISRIKETKAEVSAVLTDLAVSKAEFKNISDNLVTATKQVNLASLHSSWNDRVESLKKIFKYNALPMVLSYRYMAQVVVELNNTLSQIGVPFTIELEHDLSFTVNFGFQKVPASRLSGGQKVILTIAYRLAVNFTFATNLGLLCLDEPTVGLDEANLGSLERAFERLKDFSLSNGVQIIVVTHEKGLSHLFDHTIDLTQV